MYSELWSSPRRDGTEEAEVVSKFEPGLLKTRVLMAGEMAGGVSPLRASGQQRCLPRAASPASLARSSMETSPAVRHSLPLATGPLGTSPSSQLPWGAAIFLSPAIIASL